MMYLLLQLVSMVSLVFFTISVSVLFSLYCEKNIIAEEYIQEFKQFVFPGEGTSCTDRLSLLCLLLSAFFIPLGSLPSYFYTEYSAFIVMFLFMLSHYFHSETLQDYCEKYTLQDVLCFLIFSSFSVYAHFFGIPGKTGSFESLTLINLWLELPPLAVSAMLIFALSFMWLLLSVVYSRDYKNKLYPAVERYISSLIFVACFIPFDISFCFKLTGAAAFICDTVFTLLAAFIIQLMFVWMEKRVKDINKKKNTAFSAVFAGVLLTLISIYIY